VVRAKNNLPAKASQLRKQPLGHLAELLGLQQAQAGVAGLGDQPGLDKPAERAGEGLAGEVQMAGDVPFQPRQFERAIGGGPRPFWGSYTSRGRWSIYGTAAFG